MNLWPSKRAATALRAGLVGAALGCSVYAFAQAIPVTTPRLPPRGAGPGPAPQPGAYTSAGAPPGAYPGAYTGAQPGVQPATYGAAAAQSAYGSPGAAVMPQRAPAGACRAQPTPDRQTLLLVSGPDALARAHLPLGEFRAQQVVHSPDGRWAVAFTKLRGAAQYAAMTIDLERCELQRVIDLSTAGEDARFEGDEVLLRLADGERRVGLRDGRVR